MDVGIIGAGVAGAAAAIVLAQLGHTVRICERRVRASTLGAGVTLWPNAAFVLDQLELMSEVTAVSGRPRAMHRVDAGGKAIATIDIAAIDALSGFATHSILRADLQRILLSRLAELGVSVRYGCVAREVGESGARPWVEFEDGTRIECDLLLGADGRVSSVARNYVAAGARAKYQGFVNWVGISETSDPLLDDPSSILDFWGSGTRFGIVPISGRRCYWAGARAMTLDEARLPHSPGEEPFILFSDWPEPVQRVLAHASPESVRKIPIFDLDPIPTWHRGHVLLVGDAAHASLPTSGQGACQALEDAWHLGRCLEAEWTDLDQVFTRFTELRHAKTSGITRAGRQLAQSLFHGTAEDYRRRDEAARTVDPLRFSTGVASAWGAGLPLASAMPRPS